MVKKIIKKDLSYSAKDIDVLKGLEPVRKRPGMYIGSTGKEGLHHLVWECLDNSIDEALAGYADRIEITLLPENKVRVVDNGRGVPVDEYRQSGKSALEIVMTTLHAGAKLGSKAYQVAGGLHGVGVSVVCALSKHLRVEVCREGTKYFQEYSQGKAVTKLEKAGSCSENGTSVTFAPDPEIFSNIQFSWLIIVHHLRQQAYLTPGVKIIVLDQRKKGEEKDYTFYFEGGINSYVRYLIGRTAVRHPNPFYAKDEEDGIQVEIALQYTEDIEIVEECFANNIYTPEGGSHLTGFRSSLTRVINNYARKNDFLKENEENLGGNAVREGMVAVVSVKLREPEFEGQTKAKLGNPKVKNAVEKIFNLHFNDYLERNPQEAKIILEGCLRASRAQRAAKAARATVLEKHLRGMTLPGKLADCSSRKPQESEIYIVEGESAGGSAKQARNRAFQAILPLRGKILNVEKAHLPRILESKEIKALIIALGTAIADDFCLDKLRYHRIIIMSDADIDGAHIRTLLLTLFYRYFRPLIEGGYLYIAQPPLYQVRKGKKEWYVYNDREQENLLKKLEKPYDIQRYKGLGEMNPEQLWETTMNPEKRILKRVTIDDGAQADHIFDSLMGKEVLPRKKFIRSHAKFVQNLDI